MQKPIIGDPYGNSMGIASALMTAARLRNDKLSPEERQANKDNFERIQTERRIRALILQNTCPSCEGKLVRGKKNKKKDYKREWTCGSCKDVYIL